VAHLICVTQKPSAYHISRRPYWLYNINGRVSGRILSESFSQLLNFKLLFLWNFRPVHFFNLLSVVSHLFSPSLLAFFLKIYFKLGVDFNQLISFRSYFKWQSFIPFSHFLYFLFSISPNLLIFVSFVWEILFIMFI